MIFNFGQLSFSMVVVVQRDTKRRDLDSLTPRQRICAGTRLKESLVDTLIDGG